jgi:hypothetical protein
VSLPPGVGGPPGFRSCADAAAAQAANAASAAIIENLGVFRTAQCLRIGE